MPAPAVVSVNGHASWMRPLSRCFLPIWPRREKEKAGEALVTPDTEHRYNLPEGVRYELQGEGLIIDEKVEETPFSGNPLDTLNSGFLDKQ